MKHNGRRMLSLLLALLLLGTLLPSSVCAEEGGTDPISVTGVMLNSPSLLFDQAGDPGQLLTAILSPGNASDKTVSWASSDPAVVTVTPVVDSLSASVEPQREGTAVITVTTRDGNDGKGFTASCPVRVGAEVREISISNVSTSITLDPGVSKQLLPLVSPTNAACKDVEWSSSNEDVLAITVNRDSSATITGRKAGTSTVRLASKDVTSDPAGRTAPYTTCSVTVSGILFPNKTVKVFPYATSQLNFTAVGSAVGMTQWAWSSSDSNLVSVDPVTGVISAGSETGTATITCVSEENKAYIDSCTVEVVLPETTIRTTLDEDSLSLSDISFQSKCPSGDSVSYVTGLSVSPNEGTLYYNYKAESNTGDGVSSTERYYTGSSSSSGNCLLKNVLFLPRSGFSGQATITYACGTRNGAFFSGQILVDVEEQEELSYTTSGDPILFSADDFNRFCVTNHGRPLSYVTFTLPSARYGTLYYNYTGPDSYDGLVSPELRYYRSSTPALGSVSFVPASGYRGSFTLSYRVYDAAGNSYRDTMEITVGSSSEDNEGDVTYNTAKGKRVSFRTADFVDYYYDMTGYTLDYVIFTSLPASTKGKLYYDGDTTVRTYDSFYRTGSSRDLLEDVSFLPYESYVGSVSIPFTAYSSSGRTQRGTVIINVGSGTASASLSYRVQAGLRVYFSGSDFSSACYRATGRSLDYITFSSLPSASQGTLYCSGVKADTRTSYYRAGSGCLLDDVSFLASSVGSGTVSIPFRGYDTRGVAFDGTVAVTVDGTSGSGAAVPVFYKTSGPAVTFQADDLAAACVGNLPGKLYRVYLTPPSSSVGKLCINYAAPSQYRAFTYDKAYSPTDLSQISFVPKAGFQGTAVIPFTATDPDGKVFSSVITVTVTPPAVSAFFSDMESTAWANQAVDFLRRYDVVSGISSQSYGPKLPMRRGDYVLMLNKAFALAPAPTSTSFPDVPKDSYYAAALAAAKNLQIVTADAAGNFRPGETVTRLDAAIFLYRCLQRSESIAKGTADDLARFSDRDQVPAWAVEAMGALVRRGVFAGDNYGRLNPNAPLTRAEMAVILYQAVT